MIELLVIVGIIGLIAAIAIPAYVSAQEKLQKAKSIEADRAARVTVGAILPNTGTAPFTFEHNGHTYVALYNCGMLHDPDCKCHGKPEANAPGT